MGADLGSDSQICTLIENVNIFTFVLDRQRCDLGNTIRSRANARWKSGFREAYSKKGTCRLHTSYSSTTEGTFRFTVQ